MSRRSRVGQSHVSRFNSTIRRACIEALEHRRLLSFGDLDPLFSSDGRATTNFGATDTGRAALVQPDGKILVAGAWDGGASEFALARYNPNGTLDTTFGGEFFGAGSGMTNAGFTGALAGEEFALDMALQADGKIVLVGYTNLVGGVPAVGGNDFAIARFTATGALDATFSGDGLFTADFGADDRASGVAIRSDGDIVVGGSFDGGSSDFAVLRLNPNGTLDAGFDLDGRFSFTLGALDFCNDIALQSDNKIVMVGYTSSFAATINDMAVARVNANGGLDVTYDVDGVQRIDFGNDDRANAGVIDPAGRAVVAGSWDGGSSDFAIARLTAAGALDATFSGDGLANATFGAGVFGGAEFAQDVALRRDGDIEVVGYTDAIVEGGASGATNNFGVLRLNSDGSFDNTFDGNARKLIDFGGNDLAYSVARDQDGTLIAAGITGSDFAIARLRGALDISFSSDGIQKTNFGNTDTGREVLVQPDGKILVAGSWDGGASDFALARYNADGTPDAGFGGGVFGLGSGMTNCAFGPGFGGQDFALDMALQPDGRIVLVGHTDSIAGVAAVGGNDWAIARFTSTGALDATFSGDGKFTVDWGFDDRATGVAIRPDGKIVIGGYLDGGGSDFGCIRLNPNGTVDATFQTANPYGVPNATSVDLGGEAFANDLALQSDGKIVLAGYIDPFGAVLEDVAVVRLNANGGLDPTFNGTGINIIDQTGGDIDRGNAVAIDSLGFIVVVGQALGVSTDFLVARFRPNGVYDAPFSSNWAFGFEDIATSVIVQPDGKWLVAGYTNANGLNDFAIIRLNTNGTSDPTFEAFGTHSFAGGGEIVIDMGGTDQAFGVAIQPNGHVLLAGISDGDFAVARLAPRMIAASAEFQFETVQQVLVQFSSPFVGLVPADFTLQNLTTLAFVPAGTMAVVNLGDGLAQLRFPGQNNLGVVGALPDGDYRLTLPPGAVTDTAGNLNVGTFTFDFFFKMADTDRDRDVDLDDFNIVASNFNPAGHVFSEGNLNYSAGGAVNLDDFNLLASLFNTSLAPPSSSGPSTRLIFGDEGISNRRLRIEEELDPLAILS